MVINPYHARRVKVNDHNNFVISSKMSIINIFNISTNNVSLLYLNDSRNINEISANINIYNSIFINDNNLFEIYLKPNDFISINTSNFIQSTMNIFSGKRQENDQLFNKNQLFIIIIILNIIYFIMTQIHKIGY